MGLDMYLYAEVEAVCYEGNEPSPDHQAMRYAADQVGLPADNVGVGNYGYVSCKVQAGYWRKANAIHAWFVERVQGGVDECQRSDVSIEQLHELREACIHVLSTARVEPGGVFIGLHGQRIEGEFQWINKYTDGVVVANAEAVAEILPTRSGFCFGSTDYDEWYLRDLGHTIDVVDACVALHERHSYRATFTYQASW